MMTVQVDHYLIEVVDDERRMTEKIKWCLTAKDLKAQFWVMSLMQSGALISSLLQPYDVKMNYFKMLIIIFYTIVAY